MTKKNSRSTAPFYFWFIYRCENVRSTHFVLQENGLILRERILVVNHGET